MDESGHTPDAGDADYAEFLRTCRRKVAAYVAAVTDAGHSMVDVLRLVSEHMAQSGDGERCAAEWAPERLEGLRVHDRRMLTALTAGVHGVAGWRPTELMSFGSDDGAHIPAVVVARLMVGTHLGEGDTALVERLLSTMPPSELNWMVCVCGGMLRAMGFTSEATIELDPLWTVDAP